MSVMVRRPVLRWAVPVGVLAAVLGASAAGTALSASAGDTLPARTPAQLLADLQSARLDGASGTVVERADLGIPALPAGLGGDGNSNLDSLVSGSHTLRVWYSGPDKGRVALVGSLGESDVIRNGTDLWTWSSETNTATHRTLPAGSGQPSHPSPTDLPTSPQQAADQILAMLDPSTSVSTADTVVVAGRSAYDLVLTPKDSRSLIGSVRVAVDGQRHVPLRVQLFARGYSPPAFEIGFTKVSFTRPGDRTFTFTPPPGVQVREDTGTASAPATPGPEPVVIGTGWTSVLAARVPADALPAASPTRSGKDHGSSSVNPGVLLNQLPTVSGPWGSGRLLQGRLFSVLLTTDGRILVGAVSGAQLTAAAGDPRAALK